MPIEVVNTFVMNAMHQLAERWAQTSTSEIIWVTVGFVAQFMFMMRFVIQWFASEKAKRSVMPEAFWYWSIAGGALLFIYAIYRVDPVFILGQGTGLFIYIRNLQLIMRQHRETRAAELAHTTCKPAE